jgi:hypothetical protein
MGVVGGRDLRIGSCGRSRGGQGHWNLHARSRVIKASSAAAGSSGRWLAAIDGRGARSEEVDNTREGAEGGGSPGAALL